MPISIYKLICAEVCSQWWHGCPACALAHYCVLHIQMIGIWLAVHSMYGFWKLERQTTDIHHRNEDYGNQASVHFFLKKKIQNWICSVCFPIVLPKDISINLFSRNSLITVDTPTFNSKWKKAWTAQTTALTHDRAILKHFPNCSQVIQAFTFHKKKIMS